MNKQDIIETPIWRLYEKGQDYHRLVGIYDDTDRNYRFYNGDQWDGAKLGEVEPVQKNFIKPIVKYKVAVIHDNLYAINYSSQNYETPSFQREAERYCKMLNAYASRIWERDKMDFKCRRISKDSAINGEGIMYVSFDREKMYPVNEIVEKSDIYYGNENDDDIQAQPYILMRKRMAVPNAIEFALSEGMSEDKTEFIIGDSDTFEESGDAAKNELDNGVTVVYKLYKKNGIVHYSVATKWVTISEDNNTGLSLFPIAHFNWEEKKGSARGEGEVKNLIPNQIEVNKTELRRIVTVKYQAYPQKIADYTKITNPSALNTVGGIIKTTGQTVDDVRKVVGVLEPARMSPDVKELQDSLIQVSRDLAGAGETATGEVDPEAASGRAILAVQAAQRAPVTEQKESCKNFIEDLSKIWLEYLIVHSVDGVSLEDKVTDPETGKEVIQLVRVPQSVLQKLQAFVRIDITPKSPLDKFAQEQTLENLATAGFFRLDRLGELEAYVEALDDDSVAPKVKLQGIVDRLKKQQLEIAMIEQQAQLMQQRAQQFFMQDPDGQAAQISDAQRQLEAQIAAEEEEYTEEESELDEETAEAEEETDEE